MATESQLPTADEMLDRAAAELKAALARVEEAADWLRSDWRPLGSPLTREQAARRHAIRDKINVARLALRP